MGSDIGVIGFGQCGSRVAIDVSGEFDPTAVLSGKPPASARLRLVFERWGRRKPSQSSDIQVQRKPDIYIGDLNSKNGNYLSQAKIQKIAEVLQREDSKTAKDDSYLLSVLKSRYPELGFSDEDLSLIGDLRANPGLSELITPLYFESGSKILLEVDGAGGQQFISEAIADVDAALLSKIKPRPNGIMFGVFALGGGTGAGTLLSLLSKYRTQTNRYTIGVGVLPGRNDGIVSVANVGRYFCRFYSRGIKDRYDSLILFSNNAAESAIEVANSKEPKANNLPKLPIDLINEYIASFIRSISSMNDSATVPLLGKSFDPMDGRIILSGLATVGYASADGFDPKRLFLDAISPMKIENDSLQGVSVIVSDDEEDQGAELRGYLEKLVVQLSGSADDIEATVQSVRSLSAFYQTIKSVTISFFVVSRNLSAQVVQSQATFSRFVKSLSGNDVSVTINCYFVPNTKKNSVFILLTGSIPSEVLTGMFRYLSTAFFADKRDQYDQLAEALAGVLETARAQLNDVQKGEIKENIAKLIAASESASRELLSPAARNVMQSNRTLQTLVGGEENIAKYLLKREDVAESFKELVELLCEKQTYVDPVKRILSRRGGSLAVTGKGVHGSSAKP